MIKEISQEIDYISEGVALLQHLGTGVKYSNDIKDMMNKKYTNPFKEGLKKFELLERIERAAKKAFQKDMTELKYYFEIAGNNNLSCAGNIVLLWNTSDARFQDTQEFAIYLDGLPEKDYCLKFGECLHGFHSSVQDLDKPKTEEPFAVISYLMKMELKDEEKWKLQKIFFDRKEHQQKVLALLEKASALVKNFSEELSVFSKAFAEYWTRELGEKNFTAYVRENMNMDFVESPLGYHVSPSFIRPNIVGFHAELNDDGTYQTPDYWKVGFLFGDDFDFHTHRTDNDKGFENYVTQVLKLLGDESKFQILTYIRDKEAYGSELAKHLNLTTATVSHHMNALLAAGLVEIKRIDTRIYYTTNKTILKDILERSQRLLIGEDAK